jgi:hypothetical protein
MWYSLPQLESMLWPKKAKEVMLWVIDNKQKKNKYNAVKTEWNDSKKENKRLKELQILEKAWKIQNLQEQIIFVLQEWFECNWNKIRAIKYIADFVYKKDWIMIVEDTKWFITDVFKIKKKMFLKRYGEEFLFIES